MRPLFLGPLDSLLFEDETPPQCQLAIPQDLRLDTVLALSGKTRVLLWIDMAGVISSEAAASRATACGSDWTTR